MDTRTASDALGLDDAASAHPAAIESAYSGALAARHPLLYPAGSADRATAERWAEWLGEARDVLLEHASQSQPIAPGMPGSWAAPVSQQPAPPKRGLSGWGIAGIVGGAVALLGLLAGGAAVVAGVGVSLAHSATADMSTLPEGPGEPDSGSGAGPDDGSASDSDWVSSGDNAFTFGAATEWYDDGRYDDLCQHDSCWELDVIPDQSCSTAKIISSTAVGDDDDGTLGSDVVHGLSSGEPYPYAFGSDGDEQQGWIVDVLCLDSDAATT